MKIVYRCTFCDERAFEFVSYELTRDTEPTVEGGVWPLCPLHASKLNVKSGDLIHIDDRAEPGP